MKKLVNGELVDLTLQEQSVFEAEAAALEASRADREWKDRLSKTDAKIPRYVEDIIDALDISIRAKIAKETIDAYNEKKLIRAEKSK